MNKSTKRKFGLLFGITMALFFIVQDVLTHDNLTTKNIFTFISYGLIGGAITGLLFSWLIGLFLNPTSFAKGVVLETDKDETILLQTPANHFRGLEAVGGKLYLTNKRLVFKSHKFNIQNHQWAINVSDIHKVERYETMGLVNKGISITTVNKVTNKFTVEQADDWYTILVPKAANNPDTPISLPDEKSNY